MMLPLSLLGHDALLGAAEGGQTKARASDGRRW